MTLEFKGNEKVRDKFLHWLLVDEKHGVIRFAKDKEIIQNVADLYFRKINGEKVSKQEWLDAANYAAAAKYAADTAYAAYAAAAYTAAYAYAAAAYAADAAAYADTAYADTAYAADTARAAYAEKVQEEKLAQLFNEENKCR